MDRNVEPNAITSMLGRIHKILGESTLGTDIVVKIRNQCDAVVRARFSDGSNAELNGELLLISVVAPRSDEVLCRAAVRSYLFHSQRL